jgi:hypothetical protein
MKRLGLLGVVIGLGLGAVAAVRADEAKGDKVAAERYTGYFESNKSGLKGDNSYLFFSDEPSFHKVFQPVPPTGDKKPLLLPEKAFDKLAVAAVIKRASAITEYELEKVTDDKGTLYIQYKAKTGKPTTATFASPLIVGVPRAKYTAVVFIENGKTVETVKFGEK